MWHEGVIGVPKKGGYVSVKYSVKSYDEGSIYGIGEGRISKLCLSINGQQVANYDRGWDMEPTCEEAEFALAILLHEYN